MSLHRVLGSNSSNTVLNLHHHIGIYRFLSDLKSQLRRGLIKARHLTCSVIREFHLVNSWTNEEMRMHEFENNHCMLLSDSKQQWPHTL